MLGHKVEVGTFWDDSIHFCPPPTPPYVMAWLHWEVKSMVLKPLNVAGSSRFGWPVRWHGHDNLGPGYKKNPFSGEMSSHHVKCPHTLRPPCSEKPMEMLHGGQGPDEQGGLSWHQVDQWGWSPSSVCGLQKRQWSAWLGLSHQVWGTCAACARGLSCWAARF